VAIIDWIDEVTRVWEINDGKGGLVKSYRLYESKEFPEALAGVKFPCALTYVVSAENQYSLGGPCIDTYEGVTEFHLAPNVSKANLPYILPFFARIRDAAAAHMNLGGLVAWWMLKSGGGEPSISLVTLQYGDESPHLGLMVRWTCKENVSGDFTPAMG
jgi:hypothetical protein